MEQLAGKLALVTGGTRGIGYGIARALISRGANVLATHHHRELDPAVVAYAASTPSFSTIRSNVADRNAMAQLAEIVEQRGGLDILCNNAGVNLFVAPFEMSYTDWDWLLGTNLGGVVNSLVALVPSMIARNQGGHIVNVASMAGFLPLVTAGAYAASKAAVRALTESLRLSLAEHDIGVSLVCPGLVNSDIVDSVKFRPGVDAVDDKHDRIAAVHSHGMDPLEVGEKVVAGIRENRQYIFTHPEFEAELQTYFERVARALPSGPVDPDRESVERKRRAGVEQALARAAKIK